MSETAPQTQNHEEQLDHELNLTVENDNLVNPETGKVIDRDAFIDIMMETRTAYMDEVEKAQAELAEAKAKVDRPGVTASANDIIEYRANYRALRDREKTEEQDLEDFMIDFDEVGGNEILEAQAAVDALNFKSDANERVAAQTRLRDAKNAAYEKAKELIIQGTEEDDKDESEVAPAPDPIIVPEPIPKPFEPADDGKPIETPAEEGVPYTPKAEEDNPRLYDRDGNPLLKFNEYWQPYDFEDGKGPVMAVVDEMGNPVYENGRPVTKEMPSYGEVHYDDYDNYDYDDDDEPEHHSLKERMFGEGSWIRNPRERFRALMNDPERKGNKKKTLIALGAVAGLAVAYFGLRGIHFGGGNTIQGVADYPSGTGGAGHVPPQGTGGNSVPDALNGEFSPQAHEVTAGEGWLHELDDIFGKGKLTGNEKQELLHKLLESKDAGIKDWVYTMKDGNPGISHSGQIPESVLESIKNLR